MRRNEELTTEMPLVIIGAGGFGREAVDVVDAVNKETGSPRHRLLGVVDSDPSATHIEQLNRMGVTYLGTERQVIDAGIYTQYIVGVGEPSVRKRIVERLMETDWDPATVIHPSAVIGSNASISPGTVICGGAQISTNVSLGPHVHLNANSTIGHDCALHSYVSINPGAVISGNVTIERESLVGAGAIVLQGLQVGAESLVGAGAVITRDVEPKLTVSGVPARPMYQDDIASPLN